jgi:hypothetical protein
VKAQESPIPRANAAKRRRSSIELEKSSSIKVAKTRHSGSAGHSNDGKGHVASEPAQIPSNARDALTLESAPSLQAAPGIVDNATVGDLDKEQPGADLAHHGSKKRSSGLTSALKRQVSGTEIVPASRGGQTSPVETLQDDSQPPKSPLRVRALQKPKQLPTESMANRDVGVKSHSSSAVVQQSQGPDPEASELEVHPKAEESTPPSSPLSEPISPASSEQRRLENSSGGRRHSSRQSKPVDRFLNQTFEAKHEIRPVTPSPAKKPVNRTKQPLTNGSSVQKASSSVPANKKVTSTSKNANSDNLRKREASDVQATWDAARIAAEEKSLRLARSLAGSEFGLRRRSG